MDYIFGDLHAKSSKLWHLKVLEEVELFFRNFEFNKNDTVFFLGDIYDSAIKCLGKTAMYVNNIMLSIAEKAENVYILTGNHDLAKYYSFLELDNFRALDSLKIKDNIKIIEEPTVVKTNQAKYLCLPHINYKSNIVDFYKDYDFSDFEETDYTLTHFSIGKDISFTESIPVEYVTDVFKSKDYFCGHIHNSVNSHYPGSIYACNRKQSDPHFYVRINNGKSESVPLPNFVEFKTIEYGELPEITDDLVVYYVNIKDNTDMSIYKDYYIANIVFNDNQDDTEEEQKLSNEFNLDYRNLISKIIQTIEFKSDKRSLERFCLSII